jgi:hypothetical protein
VSNKQKTPTTRIKVSGRFSKIDVFNPIRYDNATDSYVVDHENGKFEVQILLPKQAQSIKNFIADIDSLIARVERETGVKVFYNNSPMSALRDGDDMSKFREYKDLYAGNWVLTLKRNAMNKFTKTPNTIKVFSMKDKTTGTRTPITKDDVDLIEEQVYRGVSGVVIGKAYVVTSGANKGVYFNPDVISIGMLTERLDNGGISYDEEDLEMDSDIIDIFMDKLMGEYS